MWIIVLTFFHFYIHFQDSEPYLLVDTKWCSEPSLHHRVISEIIRVDQIVLGSEVGLITTQGILIHSSEDVPNRFVNGIEYKRDMGDENELVSGSPILMLKRVYTPKGITVSTLQHLYSLLLFDSISIE
jgi:hypothetical protein